MVVFLVVLLALVVVLATSLIKNVHWSPQVKNLVAVVLSVPAGLLVVYFGAGKHLNYTDYIGFITSIYGASQLVYNFILKSNPVGQTVENKLAAVRVVNK